MLQKAVSGFRADFKSDMAQYAGEPYRAPGISGQPVWKLFDKGLLRTVGIPTAKAPYPQVQPHSLPNTRQLLGMPLMPTMRTPG